MEPQCTIDGSSSVPRTRYGMGILRIVFHGKRSIQQGGGSFHQQIGRKFKEETSTVLHLYRSLIWCLNLDTAESSSETPGKFRNVVLERDGEDHLDGSCEK